jgi:4-amino-4-deoxy-L-arabinose transferase-like glycosyltransferase
LTPAPRFALAGLVVALFVAYAWPMQVNGWNQNAHYALVRALADGVPYIDKSRTEIGDLGTGDLGRFQGHVFATKPPGLALFTLPAFWAVDFAGARTTGDPTRPIWLLHLWSSALPGALLVLAVALVANRLEPGYGFATGALLGLGTLVLPFSTMLFNHVLSTLLAFAAFALLWLERERGPDRRLVAAAGVATGLGVAVDFQVGFAAPVLLLYALGSDRLRRGLLYFAASLVGALPLWAFNLWAFGNPLHTSYEDYHQVSLGDDLWRAYVRVPSLETLGDLFLSSMGVLVLMPVLAAGGAGIVLL